MRPFQILSLAGASIGIITIILGIVALSTKTWIVLTRPMALESTYSLFKRCNKALIDAALPLAGCKNLNDPPAAQGLIIAGVVIIGLGIVASIFIGILFDNRWIKLIPNSLVIIGPTFILIGALLYVKNVLGNFTEGTATLNLGYSLVLILVTCIIGYVLAAYFFFVTGFSHGQHHERLLHSPHNYS